MLHLCSGKIMHANLLHMSYSCELHENVGMCVTYVNAVISSGEMRILAQTSLIYFNTTRSTIQLSIQALQTILILLQYFPPQFHSYWKSVNI